MNRPHLCMPSPVVHIWVMPQPGLLEIKLLQTVLCKSFCDIRSHFLYKHLCVELLDHRACLPVRNWREVFQRRTKYKEHVKGVSELASRKERLGPKDYEDGAGNPEKPEQHCRHLSMESIGKLNFGFVFYCISQATGIGNKATILLKVVTLTGVPSFTNLELAANKFNVVVNYK